MKLGSFLRARWEHSRNAKKSPAEIKALQHQKFLRLVAYANERSTYYRGLIADRGIDVRNCRPSDFPVMTKTDLMENFDGILTDPRVDGASVSAFLNSSDDPRDRFLDEYVVLASTGSNKMVGHCLYTPDEWARGMALYIRTLPFSWRRRRLAAFGLMAGHEGGASGADSSRGSAARLRFDSRSFDSQRPFEETAEQLNAFQPDIVAGLPTSLTQLAHAQEAGVLRISPSLLSLGGDALRGNDRPLIERAFGVPISNHYGASETLTMGYGLTSDDGLYLFEDEFIFEIEDGQILVTSLFKYAQPLIRYALGDHVSFVPDPSPRLPFAKIAELRGRDEVDAIFTSADGRDVAVSPDLVAAIQASGVERVQLRVVNPTECILRAKLTPGFSTDERAALLDDLQSQLATTLRGAGLGNVSARTEEVHSFAGQKTRLIVLPDTLDAMDADWLRSRSLGYVG